MNRRFTANVLSLSLASALLLSSCQTTQTTTPQPTQTQAPTSIVNGDFEEAASDGGWLGWTREDAAFNARGIVSEPKQNGVEMDFSGSKYFSGLIAGNPVMRGTLTSDPFTLGDTGFILFRMGAGQNPDKLMWNSSKREPIRFWPKLPMKMLTVSSSQTIFSRK